MTHAPATQIPLFPTAPIAAPASAPPGLQRAVCDSQPREEQLRAALAAYGLSPRRLRALAASGDDLTRAFLAHEQTPEIQALCAAFAALLRPIGREQVKSPGDIAALLMVEMAALDQEELRTVLLDTKNHVQAIETVYRGSLNCSLVRVGEVFKAALKRNSAGLIVVHNHPSGDPTPSPEDVLVTREIVAAGKLLDVEVQDHLVIGQGRYVSMRQRGLGFEK